VKSHDDTSSRTPRPSISATGAPSRAAFYSYWRFT